MTNAIGQGIIQTMLRVFAAAILLIAAPAVAADQAQQFDLACTAKRTTMHYRLDLMRGEWCFGECAIIQKIDEITSGTIYLRNQKQTSPDGPEFINRIDRATGEWYWYSYSPSKYAVPDVTRGTCVPGVFTGFPAPKF